MVHPEVQLSPLHELRWFWMLNLAASIWEQEKKGLSVGIASPHGAGGSAELQEQNQGGERQAGCRGAVWGHLPGCVGCGCPTPCLPLPMPVPTPKHRAPQSPPGLDISICFLFN